MNELLLAGGGLGAALVLTVFIRLLLGLNLLRYGLGLTDAVTGVVIVTIAAVVALAMAPADLTSGGKTIAQLEEAYRPQLTAQIDPSIARSLTPAGADSATPEPFSRIVSAFVLSEVKRACEIGLLFLVPFVVLDLVLAHLLTVLGITQMSVQVIGVPLKLLLFLAADGWGLVMGRLLAPVVSGGTP